MSNDYELDGVIISREEIENRAKEIAGQITEDYKGEEIYVIGILKGAVLWMSEVLKNLDVVTKIDFMAVSSYGASTKSSGVVKINKDLDDSVEGKNVIIMEDIVDSGVTLNYLKEYLTGMHPKSLRICTLLDKPEGRKKAIDVDYVGFEVGHVFIVGFGLDYNQRFRNLPYITSLKEKE
jgi:hypoxanthine phosphoribosyltransferase